MYDTARLAYLESQNQPSIFHMTMADLIDSTI